MRWRNSILFFTFFCVSVIGATAQDANEVAINMAVDEFNTGHFHSVPELLSPYLNTKQSREWRQRAYLLLTQTYLLLEDPEAAKNSYLKVLEANPEYVPNPELDPTDLVYFGSKFTTAPVFSLFAYAGSNASQVTVIKNTSAVTSDPDKDPIKIKYAQRVGFQFGAGAEWHYDENISLSAELNYIHTSFFRTISKAFKQDDIEAIDRQNWLRLPISVKFSDHVGKYRPYGYIGFSLDYLLNDNATITTINNDSLKSGTAPFNSQRIESPKQDFTPRRYRFNNSFLIGGGLKYKIGFDYVFIDIRYSLGMRNVVSKTDFYYKYSGDGDMTSDKFLETGTSTFDRGYVDDFFRMNNIMLSIGYVHPLYKPRELKHGKSKSILKRIKKQDEKR